MSKRALASFVVATVMFGCPFAAAAQVPVRVGGEIREPRKITDVKPVYPDIARQARIQGIVILEAVVGVDGSVQTARVLRPAPMLDQAALEAVTQWKYEPTLLNGVPVPVIMTVTVTFSLGGGTSAPPRDTPVPTDVYSLLDYAKAAHAKGLLSETERVLQRALQAIQEERIKASGGTTYVRVGPGSPANLPVPAILSSTTPPNPGVVTLEVTIDATGRVTDAKVLRSGGGSDQAVIDAVKQWRFAPTMMNGVAVPVITTITVK